MAVFELKKLFLPTIFLLLLTITHSNSKLDAHYYDQTCPQAEKIILQTVRNASIYDPRVPARLLRMFFHDCFIRSGGPYWNVLKGRKDGRISKANETINLPAPTFNVSQLIQSFGMRGLGVKDLVSLSGGHSLGFSHCSSFASRLHNFSLVHDVDPIMNINFALELKKKCPKPNKDRNAGDFLDSTPSIFDNNYYKLVVAGKALFGSDQALFGDERTRWIVEKFAGDQDLFFKEFATSMVRLGNVGVVENGEVRLNCRLIN
ncbi:peroxidase 66 isoform X2 [Carica papaya]|uniref:peroxidase 66 isoform X2 n=1 Tax=Carica papaya TaxID=3649 RepID=UPI000B8C86EF|nr:peroxidase 66 isoform X2 [Carica papaya]